MPAPAVLTSEQVTCDAVVGFSGAGMHEKDVLCGKPCPCAEHPVQERHRAEAEGLLRRISSVHWGYEQYEKVAETLAAAEKRGLDLGRADAWIPVGESLPEPREMVQFHVPHINGPCVGNRGADRGRGHEWEDLTDQDMCGDCETYSDEQVTHWRPLAAPPKVTP